MPKPTKRPTRTQVLAALRVLMGHGSLHESVDTPSAEEIVMGAPVPLRTPSCFPYDRAERILLKALGY